jgi:hypothetical protein
MTPWMEPRPGSGRRWPMLAFALGLVALVGLAIPHDAEAVPNPLDLPGKAVGAAGDALGGAIGGGAERAFDGIINRLFGGLAANVTTGLITWLIAVPNFTGGNVGALSRSVQGIAFGVLGAVMTIAVIRYWLAGLSLSGSGGYEAVEGFSRTVGAALFVVAWPFLFRTLVALVNQASYAVMHTGPVTRDVANLLGKSLVVGSIPNGVGLLIKLILALATTLMVLGLVLMKIVMSTSLAFLFVAMPIAVILWPISELSWLARLALRALATILLMPLVWALCFALFAAIGVDAISFQGGGGVLDKAIIKPLAACALLYAAMTIPRLMLRAATLGAQTPGGGFAGRTGSYLAAGQLGRAVTSHVPAAWGGSKPPDQGQAPAQGMRDQFTGSPGSHRGGVGGALATVAAVKTGGATAAAARSPTGGVRPIPQAGAGITGEARDTMPTAGFDLARFHERLAQARQRTPTREQAQDAYRALSAQQRRAVADLHRGSAESGAAREELMRQLVAQSAHHAHAPERQEAFSVLASSAHSGLLGEVIGERAVASPSDEVRPEPPVPPSRQGVLADEPSAPAHREPAIADRPDAPHLPDRPASAAPPRGEPFKD